jgi:hypothetical protein
MYDYMSMRYAKKNTHEVYNVALIEMGRGNESRRRKREIKN